MSFKIHEPNLPRRLILVPVFAAVLSAINVSAAETAFPMTLPGLKLWVSAKDLKGYGEKSTVSEWKDRSPGRLVLQARQKTNPPMFAPSAIGSFGAVRFAGTHDTLEIKNVSGPTLFGASKATIAMVVKPNQKGKDGDILGWGECGGMGVLFQAPYKNELAFLHGDAKKNGVLTAPLTNNWNGTAHVVILSRAEAKARIEWDGLTFGEGTIQSPVSVSEKSDFLVGNSACGHPFTGDLAELLVFNAALSDSQRKGLLQYLAGEYNLPLVK